MAFPWNATKETPKLTGEPPHALLMSEMEALRLKFDDLQATMKDDMNTSLDEKGVGGSEFHTNHILLAITDSERRRLSTLELPNSTRDISIMEESTSMKILK